ncbi:CDP-alcohol phosphatidyltransferase family protein [Kineosporia sp. A_224]|uniref:CDP-alcohol phosphatidyltransferase family protein n=1 Tax=Kineosporia sp. A_224 TaxID=1962180 RepID=UPI000B4B63AC|nr:CDP-alcohol phosphatidyltransferase family protein [Kineosporia sp. A_224]
MRTTTLPGRPAPVGRPRTGRLLLGLPPAPNLITLVRTAAAMGLATAAAVAVAGRAGDGGAGRGAWPAAMTLLVAGYLVYWVGDMADGAVARWRGETTRHGAVLDIVSDRACTTMLAVVFVGQRPETAVPLTLFLVQFCVLDTMLSLGFLLWDVDSPNDMHLVDRLLYRLNWSPPAKALNTAAVVLLVLSGAPVLASSAALGVAAVKVWSLARTVRLLDERRAGPSDRAG